MHQVVASIAVLALPVVFFAVLFHAAPLAAETVAAKALRVADGDTLWVQVDRTPRKIRLLGIDAPELCQSGGVVARQALWNRVKGKTLRIDIRTYDDYGRDLAYVFVDGAGGYNVNAAMVRDGMAWAARWRGKVREFGAEEALARKERRGIFAEANPEWPYDFRKRHGSCHRGR
ncbi:thermonuclease family protein [Candidatus Symbiobacter mobilis]|uniref:Nuclease-like protein n=1 Tax=Candidatus Symbiobacter mobilis CR TaxID=946483 RepID=U5N9P0_9BURK|nr:thermonuclease family protein [Candidatus Symbiobacter mobilis]AGX86884.1 nuclease-like protein [Candidatus Symbiobacter mobilis CR]